MREMDLRALIFEAETGEKTRLLLGNFGAETLTPKFLLEQAAKKSALWGRCAWCERKCTPWKTEN